MNWNGANEWSGIGDIQKVESPWRKEHKGNFKILFDTGVQFLDGRPSINNVPEGTDGNILPYTLETRSNSIYPHIKEIPFNCYNLDPITWDVVENPVSLDPSNISRGSIGYCICGPDLPEGEGALYFSATENYEWVE